jgi:hypothetical protein
MGELWDVNIPRIIFFSGLNLIWFQTQFLILAKARRTRAHLSRVFVIRDKLERQNFLVCGEYLRHFRHS